MCEEEFPLSDFNHFDRPNFLSLLFFFDIPGPSPFDLAATNPTKLYTLPHIHIYFILSHFLLEKGEQGEKGILRARNIVLKD